MALTEQEQALMLRREMDRQGVTNAQLRAGIAAIAMGESGFRMQPEADYAHTANSRIRSIFGARIAMFTDEQLDELKVNPEAFFNRVYGGTWGQLNLGNSQPGDGFKFRGRGLFQLTGRGNYNKYGHSSGHPEIVDDPDLADQPEIACALAVAYMKDRYHGGGWEGMKRAVGNNIADIEATKNQLFAQYLQSGEFSPPAGIAAISPPTATATGLAPEIIQFQAAVGKFQGYLRDRKLYTGPIDGDFGNETRIAYDRALKGPTT